MKHDPQPQMLQPGAPQALRAPLIKQLSGLSDEPESKLQLVVELCGLEQQSLVPVRLGSLVNAHQCCYHDCPF